MDPVTFPRAISLLSFNAAVTLTASSGREVPRATIVSPITMDGIPSFLAISEAPSTKKSAPLTSRAKPIIKMTTDTIIRFSSSGQIALVLYGRYPVFYIQKRLLTKVLCKSLSCFPLLYVCMRKSLHVDLRLHTKQLLILLQDRLHHLA